MLSRSINKDYLVNRNLNGVVLRFDEAPFFNWMMYEVPDSFPVAKIDSFYLCSEIRSVGKVLDSTMFKKAVQKLSNWRAGKISTSKVFLIDKTAKFLALLDLWGAQHCIEYNNIKMFYDANTDRFELIATDGNSSVIKKPLFKKENLLFKTFFKDAAFTEVYLSYLKEYSSGRSLSAFLIQYSGEIKSRVELIESYYPGSDNNLAYLHYNFTELNKAVR